MPNKHISYIDEDIRDKNNVKLDLCEAPWEVTGTPVERKGLYVSFEEHSTVVDISTIRYYRTES